MIWQEKWPFPAACGQFPPPFLLVILVIRQGNPVVQLKIPEFMIESMRQERRL
jgi:hypothetical protein